MPSEAARIKKLEQKAKAAETQFKKVKADAKKLKSDLAKAKKDLKKAKKDLGVSQKDIKDLIKWVEAEVKWSKEVTAMLRLINWTDLAIDYPGAGGTNPPQTPPDWPMVSSQPGKVLATISAISRMR